MADMMKGLGVALKEPTDMCEAVDPRPMQPTMVSPLAYRVDHVVQQRDALAALCGEMIGTFMLPANQPMVFNLGPSFPALLAGWRKRFDEEQG